MYLCHRFASHLKLKQYFTMAIIRNVVMRGASKRLGGVIFYTRSGETVARELAPAVSNPRTEVQMTQRIKLSNVVSAYKANKSWMAGAFEDKPEKESDYNAFVRMNLTNSKVALDKSQAAAGAGIVAPYQVSSGSIPQIDCVGETLGVSTNLYTGNLIITSATTVGQISAAIISNNNGIVHGMQLSLIVNLQRAEGNLVRPYIVARTYEMIIDETSTELLSKYFPEGILEIKDTDGHPLFYNGSALGDGAATFILSRTISGKLYVSSQTLRMYGNQSLYAFYTSDAKIKQAIQSYGENAERFLDSDTANEFNPVVLNNYIQGVSFANHLYVNGDAIPSHLALNDQFIIYFAQAVPDGATFTFYVNGEEIPDTDYELTWYSSRTMVVLKLTSAISITEDTECDFAVDYDEQNLNFEFVASPA